MSYEFPTSSDFLDGVFNTTYDSEGMTLGIWLKLTAANWALTNQGYMMILHTTAGTTSDSIRLGHTKGLADTVAASSRDGSGDNDARNGLQADHDDIWQLFFGTFTSDTLRESTAQDSGDQFSNASSRPVGAALDKIRVGSNPTGGTFCDGFLAEAAIWDKVLSDTEIDSVWISEGTGNSFAGIAPSNLIGYWPMLVDQSTHTNLGTDTDGLLTVSNAVFSSEHPTIIAASSGLPSFHGANRGIMRGVARGIG